MSKFGGGVGGRNASKDPKYVKHVSPHEVNWSEGEMKTGVKKKSSSR